MSVGRTIAKLLLEAALTEVRRQEAARNQKSSVEHPATNGGCDVYDNLADESQPGDSVDGYK